jgi:ribosomal protein S6
MPETLDEISRVLKITDGVMRHMAVRQIVGGRPQPVAAPPRAAVQEPE